MGNVSDAFCDSIIHKHLGKTLRPKVFITCLSRMNSSTCVCVHVCIPGWISVLCSIVYVKGGGVGGRGKCALSFILTSCNWNHLDTLPKPDPWVKEAWGGEEGLKQRRGKSSAIWERDSEREMQKERQSWERGREIKTLGGEKRSKGVWSLTLYAESVVIGQSSSAEL